MLLFGNQKQLFTLVTKYVHEYLTLIFNLPVFHKFYVQNAGLQLTSSDYQHRKINFFKEVN